MTLKDFIADEKGDSLDTSCLLLVGIPAVLLGGAAIIGSTIGYMSRTYGREMYFPKVPSKNQGANFADINHDGKKDLQILTEQGSLTFQGIGEDLFQLQNYQILRLVEGRLKDVYFADLNHDGLQDIFISAPQGDFTFTNMGNGIYKLDAGEQGDKSVSAGKQNLAFYQIAKPINPEIAHLQEMARSVDEQLRRVLADRGYT